MSSLAEAMDWLKEQLNVRNQDVGFCGASENVVLYAQSLLGDEVVQQRLVTSLGLLGWLVVFLLKKDWRGGWVQIMRSLCFFGSADQCCAGQQFCFQHCT